MLTYTIGEDRGWDLRLLAWDVYGSLGHVEGLRASRLLSARAHLRLRAALRSALRAIEDGKLTIDLVHEDAHTAVEDWLTRRHGVSGEQLHTGRSERSGRGDVAYSSEMLLELHALGTDLARPRSPRNTPPCSAWLHPHAPRDAVECGAWAAAYGKA
jgi:hypothetical protein